MSGSKIATDGARGTGLSRIQRLLWAGQELHPEAPIYNMALAFDLAGPLDREHFERAIQSVIERADVLRTVFPSAEGEPEPRVGDPPDAPLRVVDLRGAPDPMDRAKAWMEERARRPFDLETSLFDMALLVLASDRHVWFVNQHHLITDGWSVALLYDEVRRAYALSRSGKLDRAAPLPPYADHVRAERGLGSTRAFEKAVAHWRAELAEVRPLPLYGKRAPRVHTASERRTVDLGPERSGAIRALAERPEARGLTAHLSVFNVFAAVLFGFLRRVTGESRLAVAAPAHNRRSERDKATLGAFLEVFPLVVSTEDGDTFAELVERTAAASAGFVRYALPGASPAGASRACNVVLNYIQASFPPFEGLEMRSEWLHPGHADLAHDLRVQVHDFDEAGSFVLHFDLSTERFDASERDAVIRHFLHLADAWLSDPDQPVSAPAVAGERERERLLEGWSASKPAPDGTVFHRFAARAEEAPRRAALRSGDRVWSYGELRAASGQVAATLESHGVAGRRVALAATRTPATVMGLLGTLEARAAYVPLDPADPDARLRRVIEEIRPAVLLAEREAAARWRGFGVEVLTLEDLVDAEGPDPDTPPGATGPGPAPEDLAYVLYTSGSTGSPKGVKVSHRSLVTYAEWASRTYGEGEAFAAPLFTPLTFDLTVTSLFGPLLAGGTVVVYPLETGGVDTALLRVLEEDRVDVIKLTPAHLALLAGRDLSRSRVHTLIVGGAELRRDVAADALSAFGGDVRLFNEYGPTEATVGCMIHRFDPDGEGASVPVGRASASARIYLLDDALRPVPPGVIGEIVVGGPGVARGYLDRPEETADRFVDDPARRGAKAYRTGDLGRVRPDGTVEFLGRADRQLELHGIRIEPGEIEAALAGLPEVGACVVDRVEGGASAEPRAHCRRCGLPSNVPDVTFDEAGICSVCRSFEGWESRARAYFQPMERLEALFAGRPGPGDFDCVLLFSGGKDSAYALYRLADMGLRILAVTLDNGFISDGAKANIRRIVEALGIEHEYLSTPAMNEVFVDSLERHANVCNGCFKVMYTLATNLALERQIPYVVTGLSRGQFFETRLTEDLFRGNRFEAEDIDELVREARKAYHRVDDAVRRRLDTRAFDDDEVFERVRFVDFYRYCDVGLDEVYAFLDERVPWVRPADTGRSTNCLINDVGIWVHKRERGFHNYAWPYSWDVRMGHKDRERALRELDDEIDEERVHRILDEIGYRPAATGDDAARLVAWVVGPETLDLSEVEGALRERLPSYMVPSDYVRVDALPLTKNGKVDRSALPRPRETPVTSRSAYMAPRNDGERRMAAVWQRVLRLDRVGVHDNFFDLGGDSIAVIQIAARASDAGITFEPNLLFRHPTIAELTARATVREGASSGASKRNDAPSMAPAPDDSARARALTQLERARARAGEREGPDSSRAD